MIRPAWASNPNSPITAARQRIPRCYQQCHRGRHTVADPGGGNFFLTLALIQKLAAICLMNMSWTCTSDPYRSAACNFAWCELVVSTCWCCSCSLQQLCPGVPRNSDVNFWEIKCRGWEINFHDSCWDSVCHPERKMKGFANLIGDYRQF